MLESKDKEDQLLWKVTKWVMQNLPPSPPPLFPQPQLHDGGIIHSFSQTEVP